MVAYYRHLEVELTRPSVANGLEDPDDHWKPDLSLWLPAASSPPSLTGKTASDSAWKDALSYYGMLYIGHNGGPELLRKTLRSAEANRPVDSALNHRDYLLFKHWRSRLLMGNMARFVIALDAFLRLDQMIGTAPKDYPTAAPDTTDPNTRNWAVQ